MSFDPNKLFNMKDRKIQEKPVKCCFCQSTIGYVRSDSDDRFPIICANCAKRPGIAARIEIGAAPD